MILPFCKNSSSKVVCRHFTTSWSFPRPPPPPSLEELHANGLPLLKQVARHAEEGKILLSGWPHTENGKVEVATYHQVLSRASRVSELLLSSTTTTSDKNARLVAHLNVPGWEYAACQWGAWGAGFGSVPLALSQKTPELEHVLTDSNPHVILVGGACQLEGDHSPRTHVPSNQAELVQAAENVGMSDRLIHLGTKSDEWTATAKEGGYRLGQSGVISTLDEPALILYTSGTTGKPKGVVITHRNLYHQTTDLIAAWEWQPTDVALHMLPLHHVHGVVNLLCCAAFCGARLQFQPFHAEKLWTSRQWGSPPASDTTDDFLPKPNIFMAVPTIYAKLLEAADELPDDVVALAVKNTLQPMRLMVSGSAALPVSVLERWKQLTGHTLLERYGMTEFAMALSNPYTQDGGSLQRRHPGHVGLPLPSVQVRIVDEESGQVIETPGTSGELQVTGPTVFQSYLNRPDATQEAFTDDGYFRTGDVAEFNNELQSFRILGRASVDIIKTGGYKLSALDIERELLEHPAIADLAVLGIPDEIYGERVGMVCRLKYDSLGLTLEDLRAWCADRMAKYKVPSRLQIVDDIPKNAMGKVNKKSLRRLFD
jgi:malonyl-CoA/methylmalonyl-CoA synthetase